jgi:hypothetical protein
MVPAEVHADRLDAIEKIAQSIAGGIIARTGQAPEITVTTISPDMREGRGVGAKTDFAVWFLPGTFDGKTGICNHGFDLSVDYAGTPAIKVKSWGPGYTANATVTLPDHHGTAPADLLKFWLGIDAAARTMLHPALRER